LDADHPENGVLIPCRFTRLDLVMTFNKLSMSAAAAVLDVLEPIAVMRVERLDNLRGQVTFRSEFV